MKKKNLIIISFAFVVISLIILIVTCYKTDFYWQNNFSKFSNREFLFSKSENIDKISKSKDWIEFEKKDYDKIHTKLFQEKNKENLFIKFEFEIENIENLNQILLQVPSNLYFEAYLNNVKIARREQNSILNNLSPEEIKLKKVRIFEKDAIQNIFIEKLNLKSLKNGKNIFVLKVLNIEKTSLKFHGILLFSKYLGNKFVIFELNPKYNPKEYFTNSTLPIIKIDTKNAVILDEPKIEAEMGIISNSNKKNNVNDVFNNYQGKIAIEIRGGTSQTFAQKSYGFKTIDENGKSKNVSLLNLPEENEWILYGPYVDKTLIRNNLVYQLGREMGLIASKTEFCELVINGDYRGIYVLMQKIKVSKEMVNISKNDDKIESFILKIDKGYDDGWHSNYPLNPKISNKTYYRYYYPKKRDLNIEQKKYIITYLNNFESAIYNDKFNELTQIVDINSFVDYFIINEFTKNIDAYRLSTYLYKDKDAKLKMGPIWDYNFSLGLPNYNNGNSPNGWVYNSTIFIPFWWRTLMRNQQFKDLVKNRWNFLRKNILLNQHIESIIDSEISKIRIPYKRHSQKWIIEGTNLSPNQFNGKTFNDDVLYLKDWIEKRIDWLDKNINSL